MSDTFLGIRGTQAVPWIGLSPEYCQMITVKKGSSPVTISGHGGEGLCDSQIPKRDEEFPHSGHQHCSETHPIKSPVKELLKKEPLYFVFF